MVNFNEVRLLKDTAVEEGEKWLYSTDANDPGLKRVDEEIKDIMSICSAGGKVVILAHEGRFGKTKNLEFVAEHLTQKLGMCVEYCPENNTDSAVERVDELGNGKVIVMENTRANKGEEKNDTELAKRFAGLVGVNGKAAIGGFGKSHRANASNVGVLDYLKGYLTQSQVEEMRKLEKWAGGSDKYSVAVLGGIKKEKITDGLAGFVKTYDAVIPGGIVLNAILKARGFEVGDSVVKDGEKDCVDEVRKILADKAYSDKIIIPLELVIARKSAEEDRERVGGFDEYEKAMEVSLGENIPNGYMIVDFVFSIEGRRAIERAIREKGRIVLAGTPGIFKEGFSKATTAVVCYMQQNPENSLLLGGDTLDDIEFGFLENGFKGNSSTGGGSSLHFLAYGTTPVFESLRRNKERFG